MTPRPWWVPSTRGTAVLVTGLWCIVRGLSLPSIPEVPAAVLAYGGLVSLRVAAAVWVVAGLGCLVSLTQRRWVLAMTSVACLHVAWAVASLGAWALGESPRGWVSAMQAAAVAVWVIGVTLMVDPPRLREKRS